MTCRWSSAFDPVAFRGQTALENSPMRARVAFASCLAIGLLALGVIIASVQAAPPPPPLPPPPTIPTMPAGKQTTCRTTGPAWATWGIHTPNAPPRRGKNYLVKAWGIPCSEAKALLKALAPKIPPNRNRNIVGPEGFKCKSSADGLRKNRIYKVSCIRLDPPALFSWEPIGGKVG